MTTPVITATPEEETTAALRRMYAHKIRRLPVVDAQGKLLGIELLGARHEGARLIVPLADVGRDLPRLLQMLAAGGAADRDHHTDQRRPAVMLTTDDQNPRDIVRALARGGFEPTHISVGHKAT